MRPDSYVRYAAYQPDSETTFSGKAGFHLDAQRASEHRFEFFALILSVFKKNNRYSRALVSHLNTGTVEGTLEAQDCADKPSQLHSSKAQFTQHDIERLAGAQRKVFCSFGCYGGACFLMHHNGPRGHLFSKHSGNVAFSMSLNGNVGVASEPSEAIEAIKEE